MEVRRVFDAGNQMQKRFREQLAVERDFDGKPLSKGELVAAERTARLR